MNKLFTLCCIFFLVDATAQVPSTDIFLSEIRKKEGRWTFSKPQNITNRTGYDNQPFFSQDSKSLMFVSMHDTVQTEIFVYGIPDRSVKRITESELSEYSPQFMPDGKTVTVVRVDADKGQRLYELQKDGSDAIELTSGLDSIGYYCWLNDSTIALASLNQGLELMIYEKNNEQFVTIEKGIGRCLLKMPGSDDLLYVKKKDADVSLMMYSASRGETASLGRGLPEVEDYCFLPDGLLLGGKDGKLFSLDIYGDGQWNELADFTKSAGTFYRIQVSPDGRYLALVSYQGKKP